MREKKKKSCFFFKFFIFLITKESKTSNFTLTDLAANKCSSKYFDHNRLCKNIYLTLSTLYNLFHVMNFKSRHKNYYGASKL